MALAFLLAVAFAALVGFLLGLGAFRAWAYTQYETLVRNGSLSVNVTGATVQPLVFTLDTGLGLNQLELALLLAVFLVAALWLYCACHSDFFDRRRRGGEEEETLTVSYCVSPYADVPSPAPRPSVEPVLKDFHRLRDTPPATLQAAARRLDFTAL